MSDAREPLRHHVNYLTIGALRGVAALLVVAFHCWFTLQERFGGGGPGLLAQGTAGVDVFFVISGFVMIVSSQNLARRRDGWRVFLWRRIVRIVPLYWVMTTIMLALVVLAPGLSHHAAPDAGHVVASYLFIPSHDSAGELRPVLPDGWTLSFEMLFYLLFTLALLLRMNIFKLTVPVFAVLAVLALMRRDDWPGWTFLASELPIEFLLGAIVGSLAVAGRVLSRRAALVGLAVAAAGLIVLPTGPMLGNTVGVGSVSLRVLTYGLPAMLAVASLVALEIPARAVLPNWMLALGDASYSIYLGHGFVLAALAALLARLGGGYGRAFIIVGVVASALAGLVLYRLVESPMQTALKGWLLRPGKLIEREKPTVADPVRLAPVPRGPVPRGPAA